jgi:acetyltransferase-like isoleucine patch superfamily enzyme
MIQIRNICKFVDELYSHVLSICPSNKLFSDLRFKYYSKRLKSFNGTFYSCTGFWIERGDNVTIGNNVFFNRNVFINTLDDEAEGEVIIADDCEFGPNVVLAAGDHAFHNRSERIRFSHSLPGKIIIGEDCWVGANVTITRNVVIGKGSVIGANSVVTHDIPPYSIAVGVPARVIKTRN